MRPYCPTRFDIASTTKKLVVDNRLSLRIYYRIADNLLRQAAIFRNEKNIIDLYIMLIRFSGLVNETIPQHRDYRASPQSKRDSLKKQLVNALNELEQLNPAFRKRIKELERKHEHQAKPRSQPENNNSINSFEWPSNNKQPMANDKLLKISWPSSSNVAFEDPKRKQQIHTFPPNEQFHKFTTTNRMSSSDSSYQPSYLDTDTESHRSGSSGRYEWIWDSAGRASRLPQSPPSPGSIPSGEDKEVSAFVRGGGRIEDYERILQLEAENVDLHEVIHQLNDRVNIAEWGREQDAAHDTLVDNVSGVTSAFVLAWVELAEYKKLTTRFYKAAAVMLFIAVAVVVAMGVTAAVSK